MFKFIRKFFEYEVALAEFRIELDALKDTLDDARAERDEFKQILFKRFGLISEESHVERSSPQPIIRRNSAARVLQDLALKDREAAWAQKAAEADKVLKGETSDEQK